MCTYEPHTTGTDHYSIHVTPTRTPLQPLPARWGKPVFAEVRGMLCTNVASRRGRAGRYSAACTGPPITL
eukprot:456388-Prymnesium_polylepis.1